MRPEAACSACVHAHLSKCEPCSPRRRAAAPAHAHMTPWRQYALLACAHAHRATRQLCAAAYHGGGAAHSASGVCTHDATETAHSRSHVCVHAHLTTSSHARRTHDLPAASNEQKLRSDRNFLAWCRTRAPEGAAWRCREFVAWREQVCGGPTIYGHHFPAARVSARAHSRVKACLCTCT